MYKKEIQYISLWLFAVLVNILIYLFGAYGHQWIIPLIETNKNAKLL